MDQIPNDKVSIEEEHFEDANEKIVNELIEKTTGISISNPFDKEANNDQNNEEKDPEDNFHDCETNDLIDDESQKDFEKDQTVEEREVARLRAIELKDQGNDEFRKGNFEKSVEIYTLALQKCPVVCAQERSVIYGNRALSKIKLNFNPAAIDDCTKSIEFNPKYVKVLLR